VTEVVGVAVVEKVVVEKVVGVFEAVVGLANHEVVHFDDDLGDSS
jgi:hypothetical protein